MFFRNVLKEISLLVILVCGRDDPQRILQATSSLIHNWWNASHGSWNGGPVNPHRGMDSGMIGWWNAANTVEALVNVLDYLPHRDVPDPDRERIVNLIAISFKDQNISGIMDSRSYDDSGWCALAWIRAYELTGTPAYLQRAQLLFEQVRSEAWDAVCGGGLYWAGDERGGGNRYKNAISNELFLMTALRLHQHAINKSAKEYYFDWAQRTWTWFSHSAMLQNGSTYVAGGLTEQCSCDMSEGFTYNQGVVLGGLAMLHQLTGNHSLILAAKRIADAVVQPGSRWLHADSNVLQEPCEPSCNADGRQFKGIFLRYLGYFVRLVPDVVGAKEYCDFLETNADAIWMLDRIPPAKFGPNWGGHLDQPDAISQTSALDALSSVLHCRQLRAGLIYV